MESPRPAPPYSREADESAWKKVSNTLVWTSRGMPMPLSSTEIWKYPPLTNGPALDGPRSAGTARTELRPPAEVNFTEFESRLRTHWRSLSPSPTTRCTVGETSVESVSFFLKLCGRTDSTADWGMAFTSIAGGWGGAPAASMRERSRIDEMSRKSDSPLSRMVLR